MVKEMICGECGGSSVKEFEIAQGDICLRVMEYGATVHNLFFAGLDCVAGYDDLQGYLNGNSFQGATVGRYANRLGGATFSIGDETYRVEPNDNRVNSLHGGSEGFWCKRFTGEAIANNAVRFTYVSPHGEGGYPGNLTLQVIFTVEENGVTIAYNAVSDRDTVMNFTNHAYFNLGTESCLDTLLQIKADAITPVDEMLIPTGTYMDVTGTPFDFRIPKVIGAQIGDDHPQLKLGGGYDHNFVLGKTKTWREKVITAKNQQTGITLFCSTDLPGVQLYTSNVLDEPVGKGGKPLGKNYAFCLETQFFPDSPNQPGFPSCLVKAGETFASVTRYEFSKE